MKNTPKRFHSSSLGLPGPPLIAAVPAGLPWVGRNLRKHQPWRGCTLSANAWLNPYRVRSEFSGVEPAG